MNDQNQDASHDSPALPVRPTGRGGLRTLLLSLFVISAVGNSVASLAGSGLAVHLALGAVTAVCAAWLLADWLRARA